MGALCDMAADLVEVELHGVGVGEGQCERGARAAGGTDGAEEIGVLVALVGGLAWTRAAPGPLPDESVFLADPGFVLEPDFDGPCLAQACQVRLQRAREVFLNASTISPS